MVAKTDEELARLAQRGDAEAFMELARRHQHALYRLAYRFCGSTEDAADLCQECLIRAYKQIGKYDCQRPFAPWLMRVSSNVCLNAGRSSKGQDLERPWHEEYFELVSGDPEQEALDRMERQEVLRAVAALKPETRLMLTMKFVLGYTFREISERTGVKLPTVAFRVTRALESLRATLSAREGGEIR